MKNPLSELPLGFGMALFEYPPAADYFSSLNPQHQQQIINHTHQINSKQEMRAYVHSLPDNSVQEIPPLTRY